jgi:predicted nucleic acid-binding protein
LIVATPSDRKRVQELRENLDRGEAEAIVLSIERRPELYAEVLAELGET